MKFINFVCSKSQIPEIRKTYPRAEVKFLNGGHNIGINESRNEFLKEVVEFINDDVDQV